jgi:hypothetical protein
MKNLNLKELLFGFLLFISINSFSQQNAIMYYNGDILTMEGAKPAYAEAVVTKNGRIIFVGKKAEAMKVAGNEQRKNLNAWIDRSSFAP